MQPDIGYQHWRGRHHGVWARRGVIAGNGLRICLQGRFIRGVVILAWMSALLQTALLFGIGQLLVADSFIIRWLGYANTDVQQVARGFMAWLEMIPELSVGAVQNILFYFYSSTILTLSLVAITVVIPNLITRDLSSQAIIIYSSKAVSRLDYLLGKLATIVGVLALTWMGPTLAAWVMGNFLAPKWHFFWHARIPLAHVLAYQGAAILFLGVLALGISAASANGKSTVSLWLAAWLLGKAFVGLAQDTRPWLKFFSFCHNLDQLSLSIFHLRRDVALVQENIPVLGEGLRDLDRRGMLAFMDPELTGAMIGLGVMLAAALFMIGRKVSTE